MYYLQFTLLFIHTYRLAELCRYIKKLSKLPPTEKFLYIPQIIIPVHVGYFSNADLILINLSQHILPTTGILQVPKQVSSLTSYSMNSNILVVLTAKEWVPAANV